MGFSAKWRNKTGVLGQMIVFSMQSYSKAMKVPIVKTISDIKGVCFTILFHAGNAKLVNNW